MTHYPKITLFFVLLALGCGSGEVPVEGGENPLPEEIPDASTLDGGDDEVNQAFRSLLIGTCEKAFDCCSASAARALAGVAERADCVDEPFQGVNSITAQGVAASAEAGNVIVDAASADLCRQALGEATCDEWNSTEPLALELPGCAETIAAQLDANTPCDAAYECVTGNCVAVEDRGTVCATLVDDGQACDPASAILCKPGSYCDNFDSFTCVALGKEGDACVSDLECESQICEPGFEGTNVCQTRGSVCEATPL